MALCPIIGEMRKYRGPRVPGNSIDEARAYCDNNDLGYLHITGVYHPETAVMNDRQLYIDNFKLN